MAAHFQSIIKYVPSTDIMLHSFLDKFSKKKLSLGGDPKVVNHSCTSNMLGNGHYADHHYMR